MKYSFIIATFLIFFSTFNLCYSNDKLQLLKEKNYTLDESEFIVKNIKRISFSPNGQVMCLIKLGSNEAAIYNTKDYKFRNKVTIPLFTADTVCIQINNIKQKYYQNNRFYSLEQFMRIRKDSSMPSNFNKFSFENVEFLNDSVICFLTKIPVLRFPKDINIMTTFQLHFSSIITVLFYNLNDKSIKIQAIMNGGHFDDNYQVWIQTSQFAINKKMNKLYLISRSSYSNQSDAKLDTCVVISEVDFNGKYIQDVEYLPDFFMKTNMKYDFLYKPFIHISKEKLYVIYQLIDSMYIINKNNKIIYPLKHKGFKYLSDSLKYYKQNNYNFFNISERINKNINVIHTGIFGLNKDVIVVFSNKLDFSNDTTTKHSLMTFYSKNGTYITTKKIKIYANNGMLKYYYYSSYTDKFYFFRKTDDSWIIEECSYEI